MAGLVAWGGSAAGRIGCAIRGALEGVETDVAVGLIATKADAATPNGTRGIGRIADARARDGGGLARAPTWVALPMLRARCCVRRVAAHELADTVVAADFVRLTAHDAARLEARSRSAVLAGAIRRARSAHERAYTRHRVAAVLPAARNEKIRAPAGIALDADLANRAVRIARAVRSGVSTALAGATGTSSPRQTAERNGDECRELTLQRHQANDLARSVVRCEIDYGASRKAQRFSMVSRTSPIEAEGP
jgi:hypothetical protein